MYLKKKKNKTLLRAYTKGCGVASRSQREIWNRGECSELFGITSKWPGNF